MPPDATTPDVIAATDAVATSVAKTTVTIPASDLVVVMFLIALAVGIEIIAAIANKGDRS